MSRKRFVLYSLGLGIVQLTVVGSIVWLVTSTTSNSSSSSTTVQTAPKAQQQTAQDVFRRTEVSREEIPSFSVISAEVPQPVVSAAFDGDLRRSSSSSWLNASASEMSLDRWRRWRTKMFSVVGSEWARLTSERRVCLASQTSVDRIDTLPQLVENWSGPVSVALFAPDVDFHIASLYVAYLRRCFPSVRQRVSFHVTIPVEWPKAESASLSEIVGDMGCDDPKAVLDFLLRARPDAMMEWRETLEYPQNLLRNTAKAGCPTQFTTVPDIDMIPMPGMDLKLEDFLAKWDPTECEKCAFVVPVYEISDELERAPATKTELIRLVESRLARRFHAAIYKPNQASSRLERWEALPEEPETKAAYKVEQYIFRWEPVYVAQADTPPFDERFIGFGMTRNTQVYEMYVAGYDFYVLNNLFSVHWGLQTSKNRPQWRARQQESNNAKFDEFAKEVSARYDRDPYNMMDKLKSLNLKNVRVAFDVKGRKSVTEP